MAGGDRGDRGRRGATPRVRSSCRRRRAPAARLLSAGDTASLPIVLHADFCLNLDRRHIARTPEAAAYNDWLANELLDLVADTVAPRLAELYPAQPGVVTVLTPYGPAQGYGVTIRSSYDAGMAGSVFVPCLDGRSLAPRAMMMLPSEVPQPQLATQYCDLSSYGYLPLIDDAFSPHADRWLRTALRVRSLSPGAVLSRLRAPKATAARCTHGSWNGPIRRVGRSSCAC
jgi:hypothetical protein